MRRVYIVQVDATHMDEFDKWFRRELEPDILSAHSAAIITDTIDAPYLGEVMIDID